MAESLQDFDIEEFRLPRSLYGEIQTRQLPPRPARESHSSGVRSHSPGSLWPLGSLAPVSSWRWPLDSSGAGIPGKQLERGRDRMESRPGGAIRSPDSPGVERGRSDSLSRKPGRKPSLAILELESQRPARLRSGVRFPGDGGERPPSSQARLLTLLWYAGSWRVGSDPLDSSWLPLGQSWASRNPRRIEAWSLWRRPA